MGSSVFHSLLDFQTLAFGTRPAAWIELLGLDTVVVCSLSTSLDTINPGHYCADAKTAEAIVMAIHRHGARLLLGIFPEEDDWRLLLVCVKEGSLCVVNSGKQYIAIRACD